MVRDTENSSLLISTPAATIPHVHRLPTELLVSTFKAFVADPTPISPLSHKTCDSWPYACSIQEVHSRIALISLTCRRWRAIALATPDLWTRLDDVKRGQFARYVARSGDMPLSLYSRRMGYYREPPFSLIIRRLKRLDIHRTEGSIFDITELLFPAPVLEVCTMRDMRIGLHDYREPPDRILFANSAPKLKALSLLLCGRWCIANRFAGLTHLYLKGCDLKNLGFRRVQRFLQHTQLLQSLHLQSIAYGSEPIVRLEEPVSLPRLRSMCITSATLAAASAVMAGLALPSDVLIRLDSHKYVSLRDHPLVDSLIDFNFLRGLTHLSIAASLSRLYVRAEGPSNGVWIQSRIETTIWTLAEWVDALRGLMDLSSIHTLHTNFAFPTPSSPLLPLVGVLPQLTTLATTLHSPQKVLPEQMLMETCQLNEKFCPFVETISVQGSRLREVPDEALEKACEALGRRVHRLRRLVVDPTGDYGREGPEGQGSLPSLREMLEAMAQRHGVPLVYAEGGGLCKWQHGDMWDSDLPTRYWELVCDSLEDVLPWKHGLVAK